MKPACLIGIDLLVLSNTTNSLAINEEEISTAKLVKETI